MFWYPDTGSISYAQLVWPGFLTDGSHAAVGDGSARSAWRSSPCGPVQCTGTEARAPLGHVGAVRSVWHGTTYEPEVAQAAA